MFEYNRAYRIAIEHSKIVSLEDLHALLGRATYHLHLVKNDWNKGMVAGYRDADIIIKGLRGRV